MICNKQILREFVVDGNLNHFDLANQDIDLPGGVFENLRMVAARRFIAVVVCMAVGAVGGCALLGNDADPPQTYVQDPHVAEVLEPGVPTPFDVDPATDATQPLSYQLMFEVERVLVPETVEREDWDTIWKYVDELRVPAKLSALLSLNGIRLGIANRAGLAAMRTHFERLGTMDERSSQPVQSGYPLTIDLGALRGHEPVFTFDTDGRLSGKSYEGAKRYLHIDYDCSQPPQTSLRVTPEIFREADQPDWQAEGEEVRYQKRYLGHVFDELAVELTHGKDELLVIGPANLWESPFLLGHVMLSDEVKDKRWGIILCVRPLLFRPGSIGNR